MAIITDPVKSLALNQELSALLAKNAIKLVDPLSQLWGLYSTYFLVKKKCSRLHPVLDLTGLKFLKVLSFPFSMGVHQMHGSSPFLPAITGWDYSVSRWLADLCIIPDLVDLRHGSSLMWPSWGSRWTWRKGLKCLPRLEVMHWCDFSIRTCPLRRDWCAGKQWKHE